MVIFNSYVSLPEGNWEIMELSDGLNPLPCFLLLEAIMGDSKNHVEIPFLDDTGNFTVRLLKPWPIKIVDLPMKDGDVPVRKLLVI